MHNRYFIFKQFISDEENHILSEWILLNKDNKPFHRSYHPGTIRASTRNAQKSFNKAFPELVYTIQLKMYKIL
jgi:hypothetical protein